MNWQDGMFSGDRVVYELNERGFNSLVYFVGQDYDTKLWHAFNKGKALGRKFTSAEQAIEFCENHANQGVK